MRWLVFSATCISSLGLIGGCSSEVAGPSEQQELKAPITGGETDNGAGAHDNVVAIHRGGGLCSGTLVAPNLVLTAYHCVASTLTQNVGCQPNGVATNAPHVGAVHSASSFQIYSGVNRNDTGLRGQQILTPAGDNLCNKDIAFIVLDGNLDGVTPAAIRKDFLPQPGETVTAVGYGDDGSGFGAGRRRRKANVPIISAGLDYNQFTSSSEFVIAPAICGGDSGGPTFDTQSGALVGVTSRGPSPCQSHNGILIALAEHGDLINQAFAAAGHSPDIENRTDPGPLKTKDLGDTCTSGWECNSGVCGTTEFTTGKVCISFANIGCFGSSYKVPGEFTIAGPPDQSIPDDYCVEIKDDGSCMGCRATICVGRTKDCLGNEDCVTIMNCADACTDESCRQACIAASPDGVADYNGLYDCTCDFGCDVACGDCVAGAGGAGGSGTGGSGTGGAGTGGAAGSASAGAAGQPASGGTSSTAGGGFGATSSTGGSGGATGGTANTGNPQTNATSGDSSSCAVVSGKNSGSLPLLGLLGLGLIGLGRRRRDPS